MHDKKLVKYKEAVKKQNLVVKKFIKMDIFGFPQEIDVVRFIIKIVMYYKKVYNYI